MKICCISDLHGFLIDDIEPCDLVIICGDLVSLNCQSSSKKTKQWYLNRFKPWAEELPCDKVLFIAGNHDLHFRKDMLWVREQFNETQKVTYLENESYEYKGIKIFGSPYCKVFGDWAFMYSNDILKELYSEIPDNVDILMTHDAPYGCSDILLEEDCPWCDGGHIGNVPLREAILEKKPKYNLHGHLHSTNHSEEFLGDTSVRNCSIVTEKYTPDYDPIYLEL